MARSAWDRGAQANVAEQLQEATSRAAVSEAALAEERKMRIRAEVPQRGTAS